MPAIQFEMEKQQESDWCWAAVAISVNRFFSPKSKWCQCRLASRMAKLLKLGLDCGACDGPRRLPRACNRPWRLDDALEIVRRLDGPVRGASLTFAQIERQIKRGRPVCVRIQWGPGPNGHFVVISGCQRSRSGRYWVDVDDPFAGRSTWRLSEFRANYQYSQGSWAATYPV